MRHTELQRIPSLHNLYLHDNRLFRLENELKDLIQCCIDQYRGTGVKLGMQGNSLSQSFMDTWIPRCENTNVQLDLQPTSSADKNVPIKVNETQMVLSFFLALLDILYCGQSFC